MMKNVMVTEKEDLLKHIGSYDEVIIWGAGNMGRVLGEKLLAMGMRITYYWDSDCGNIGTCNGIETRKPFTLSGNETSTLIILAITNAFVLPGLHIELDQTGLDYLDGDQVYQILVCPQELTSFDLRECYSRKECNVATCKKQSRLTYSLYGQDDKVFINTLDVYLTQKCSLRCKYCYIYENSYPSDKKINFSTDRIIKDIDLMCGAASYIKRLVPFGGEPFLHPEIDIIIQKMANKENVGIIDLISNGIFNQPDNVLEKLKFDNVKINISNYNHAIPEDLINIREKNINRMEEMGLNLVVHNDTPQWRKPGTFMDTKEDELKLSEKKRNCGNFAYIASEEKDTTETMVVKNGLFFACQHCDTMYNLGVIENMDDAILLDGKKEGKELAKEIKKLINKKYYEACRYCNPSVELVDIAGEQGIDDRYLL